VKGPRAGRNDWSVGAEKVGLTPLAVAESMNPPGADWAWSVTTLVMLMATKTPTTAMANATKRRGVPRDKTILLTGRQTGIDRGATPRTGLWSTKGVPGNP